MFKQLKVYFKYTMEITTIKLQKNTKMQLDKMKTQHDTYDALIRRLVAREKQKHLRNSLINAYKELGKDQLETLREWEPASNEA